MYRNPFRLTLCKVTTTIQSISTAAQPKEGWTMRPLSITRRFWQATDQRCKREGRDPETSRPLPLKMKSHSVQTGSIRIWIQPVKRWWMPGRLFLSQVSDLCLFLPPPLFYGISIVLPTTDRKVCSARFSFKQSHPKESSFAHLVTSCHSQPDLLPGGSVSHIWGENHAGQMKNRAGSAMECGVRGSWSRWCPLFPQSHAVPPHTHNSTEDFLYRDGQFWGETEEVRMYCLREEF